MILAPRHPTVVDGEIESLDIAEIAQALPEGVGEIVGARRH
jgi:hypothetical protein